MPNALFDLGREGFLRGEISWNTANIKAALVTTLPSLSTSEYYSDISSAVIANSANLTGKTTTGGVADADDVTFAAVSGSAVQCVVLYADTGTPATSRLIARIDTLAVGGFPITPAGIDIQLAWDNGANRIFKL